MEVTLENFFYVVPPQSDPLIQEKFAARSDIRYLRNKQVENLRRGAYYPHQKVVHKLISLYDRLLLTHETGTGKSCSAIGIAEYFKKHFLERIPGDYASEYLYGMRSNIRHVYVLVHGPTLKREFRRQIVCVCSAPDEYSGTTENIITRQLNQFYTIEGYAKFYNDHLSKATTDEILQEKFDNTLIIVDEVHNIIPKKEGIEQIPDELEELPLIGGKRSSGLSNIYKALHRLFHVMKGGKVLLLSATPIVNEVREIAGVMNLLLPLDNQIPSNIDNNVLQIQGRDFFRPYFSGYISYAPKVKEDIIIENVGELRRVFREINGDMVSYEYSVVASEMRGEQLRQYKEQTNINYLNNFYINQQKVSTFAIAQNEYIWSDYDLRYNLDKLSCKMFTILHEIASAPNNVFIFSRFRQNIIEQIARVLEVNGYTRFEDKREFVRREDGYCAESTIEIPESLEPSLRYAILTPSEQNNNVFQRILELFNHPANRYGGYIKVLIGSPVSREGINLNNVTQIHILSPEWNEGKIHQALSRAIRINSFQSLPPPVTVRIFKHISVNPDGLEKFKEDPDEIHNHIEYSVDDYIYGFAANKQLYINRISDFMKEMAIDRYVNNPKYSTVPLPRDNTIYLTNNIDRNYLVQILQMFQRQGSYSPLEISEKLQIDIYTAYQILDEIMNKEIPVQDRFGFRGKLLRNNNLYYIEHNKDKNTGLDGASFYSDFYYLLRHPPILPFFAKQILQSELQAGYYEENLRQAKEENPIWVMAYVENIIMRYMYGDVTITDKYAKIISNYWLNQFLYMEDASGKVINNFTQEKQTIYPLNMEKPVYAIHDFRKFFPKATVHGRAENLTKPGKFQRIIIREERLPWRFLRPLEEIESRKFFEQRYEYLVRISRMTEIEGKSKISGQVRQGVLFIVNDSELPPGNKDLRKKSKGRECTFFRPQKLAEFITKLAFNTNRKGMDIYTVGFFPNIAVLVNATNNVSIINSGVITEVKRKLTSGIAWKNVEEIANFQKNLLFQSGGDEGKKLVLCNTLHNFFDMNDLLVDIPDL